MTEQPHSELALVLVERSRLKRSFAKSARRGRGFEITQRLAELEAKILAGYADGSLTDQVILEARQILGAS